MHFDSSYNILVVIYNDMTIKLLRFVPGVDPAAVFLVGCRVSREAKVGAL